MKAYPRGRVSAIGVALGYKGRVAPRQDGLTLLDFGFNRDFRCKAYFRCNMDFRFSSETLGSRGTLGAKPLGR